MALCMRYLTQPLMRWRPRCGHRVTAPVRCWNSPRSSCGAGAKRCAGDRTAIGVWFCSAIR
ncbi:hypothetical protein KCP70_21815 [Salmonella enterica subsp. enterica]|nr:hypothetical protein KCP70_21815 [Salmonella enterica subsp. enterica]